MTRMTARQIAVQLLFSTETNRISAEEAMELFFSGEHYDSLEEEDVIFREKPDEEQSAYIRRLTVTAETHLNEIDAVISRYARGWKRERLSRATLAILRCAICEILYLDDIPTSASVNEAVQLAKRYDSEQAAAFINGLLGSFVRDEKQPEASKKDRAEKPEEVAADLQQETKTIKPADADTAVEEKL